MSVLTSEQAIIAIERSSKPPTELLDDAAAVIGVDLSDETWQNHPAKDATNLTSDGAKFREQWILRWLIKKLSQETDDKKKSQSQQKGLLKHSKTWCLLKSLLVLIPWQLSQDIIIERQFCRIFSKCLDVVNKTEGETFKLRQSPVDDDDRAPKRRKLSGSRGTSYYQSNRPAYSLYGSLLDAAGQLATVLSGNQSADETQGRSSAIDWIGDIDDAAIFLARLTSATNLASRNYPGTASQTETQIGKLSRTLETWVGLWEIQVVVSQGLRNQDVHAAFTDNTLIPSLDLLVKHANTLTVAAKKSLERQIALHSILPMRLEFQKRFAAAWKTWTVEPPLKQVKLVIESLRTGLGMAAENFGTAQGEDRAIALLEVASRLIPRSDVIRRKAYSTWIEALFLCLSCLIDAPVGYSNAVVKQASTLSDNLTNGDESAININVSDKCLGALQQTESEPSFRFWQLYVRHGLARTDRRLSVATLAKLVKLCPLVFVPGQQDNGFWFLDLLCTKLSENLNTDTDHLTIILQEILRPILEEVGRTRRIDVFIEFWQLRLVESLHHRSSAAASSIFQTMWDHPDLIDIFSSVCQRYAQASLLADICKTVADDVESLVGIIGPAYESFARITVLTALLQALSNSQSVRSSLTIPADLICGSLHKALQRASDFQGQKWKLWALYEQLLPFASYASKKEFLTVSTSFLSDITTSDSKASEIITKQSNSLQIEQYCCFCSVVSLHEADRLDAEVKFAPTISWLQDLIQRCQSHAVALDNAADSWDGSWGAMNCDDKLASACLARLAASTVPVSDNQIFSDHFLTSMISLKIRNGGTGTSDLGVVAQSLLTKVAASTRAELTKMYTEELCKNTNTATHIPALLYSLAQTLKDEQQMHALFKAIFEGTQESTLRSQGTIIGQLSLLNRIVACHPLWATRTLDLSLYVKFLETSTQGATLEEHMTAYQCIRETVRIKLASAIGTGPGTVEAEAIDMIEWARKQLKMVKSSAMPSLFDQYTGYLTLSMLQMINDLGSDTLSKKARKAIDKLRRSQNSVLLSQCTLLIESLKGDAKFYQILVLLTNLHDPLDDKSLGDDLQICLQRLVQSVLALDAADSVKVSSTQEVKVIAQLWQILKKYISQKSARPTPEFPLTHFTSDLNHWQSESADSIRFLAQASKSASIAPLQQFAALTKHLGKDEQMLGTMAGMQSYISLATAIKNLVLTTNNTDTTTIRLIGRVASLQSTTDELPPSLLLLCLELSRMVCEKHYSAINQHVIDSMLTSLALLSSSASRICINSKQTQIKPEHIFDRLCTIISTLLVRYRRRLTGREHLLLPILQNLLKCLFYPPNRKYLTTSPSVKIAYLASLPQWLNPPTHTSPLTLPPSSATKFSRLLQQLCDPSSSTARQISKTTSNKAGNDNNNNLTDETKAIRRQVSQHTQYLLQTYCQVTLDGYIAPDVKEKLLPGLYAVMNAMDVEIMRALNAAMDASQRAIWKDLYSDWNSFGKWNQR